MNQDEPLSLTDYAAAKEQYLAAKKAKQAANRKRCQPIHLDILGRLLGLAGQSQFDLRAARQGPRGFLPPVGFKFRSQPQRRRKARRAGHALPR